MEGRPAPVTVTCFLFGTLIVCVIVKLRCHVTLKAPSPVQVKASVRSWTSAADVTCTATVLAGHGADSVRDMKWRGNPTIIIARMLYTMLFDNCTNGRDVIVISCTIIWWPSQPGERTLAGNCRFVATSLEYAAAAVIHVTKYLVCNISLVL